jgi:hypothetical protein
MKLRLCMAFVMFLAGSTRAYSQQLIDYSGRTLDCWQGKPVGVKTVDVLLYSSSDYPKVITQLKKVSELGQRMGETQSPEAVEAFSAAYAKLEQMVHATQSKVPHTKSGANGSFRFRGPTPDAHTQYALLAINFLVEDDLSSFDYKILTEPPKQDIDLMVGGKDGCGSK